MIWDGIYLNRYKTWLEMVLPNQNVNQLCSPLWDSNSWPLVYKTSALTTELRSIMCCDLRQNLTQQVGNLIRNDIAKQKTVQRLWDSNWRPLVYKTSALTTELRRLMCCDLRRNLTQQVWNLIRNDIAKPKTVQPNVRFELAVPSIQDQCSNHWAKEAYVLWSATEFNSTGMKLV